MRPFDAMVEMAQDLYQSCDDLYIKELSYPEENKIMLLNVRVLTSVISFGTIYHIYYLPVFLIFETQEDYNTHILNATLRLGKGLKFGQVIS